MCSLWGYCLTKSDLVCCLVILCVCVLSLRHSPMLARWKILFPWAVGVISTILGSQSPKGQRQVQCLSEDKYWSIFNPLGYLAAVYNKYRRFKSMYQLFLIIYLLFSYELHKKLRWAFLCRRLMVAKTVCVWNFSRCWQLLAVMLNTQTMTAIVVTNHSDRGWWTACWQAE